ncbi:MAG: hypothetical protein KBD78_06960 [Oligoflexales bacterium]|nr:hypothetical protein [Oligoflexales bacterium]
MNKNHFNCKIPFALWLFAYIYLPNIARAELNEPTLSLGSLFIKNKGSHWHLLSGEFRNAKTYNQQISDLKIFNNSADIKFISGINLNIASRFAFTFSAEAISSKTRVHDSTEQYLEERSKQLLAVYSHISYLANNGLDISAGYGLGLYPKHTATIQRSTLSNSQTLNSATLRYNYFSIIKNSAAWKGGIYYITEAEAKFKKYDSYSNGSQLESTDVIYQPSTYGLIMRYQVASHHVEFEVASVQASHGGLQTSDGRNIYEDHNKLRLLLDYQLIQNLVFQTEIRYKTLAYSNSEFVSLETIPESSIFFALLFGDSNLNILCGVGYRSAKDRQSQNEFNQSYDSQTLDVNIGLGISL